jgi:hypothetical protein
MDGRGKSNSQSFFGFKDIPVSPSRILHWGSSTPASPPAAAALGTSAADDIDTDARAQMETVISDETREKCIGIVRVRVERMGGGMGWRKD